jgi:hypothetical protein
MCFRRGFARLWGVILSHNGMVLSGQYRQQQYCHGHALRPLSTIQITLCQFLQHRALKKPVLARPPTDFAASGAPAYRRIVEKRFP